MATHFEAAAVSSPKVFRSRASARGPLRAAPLLVVAALSSACGNSPADPDLPSVTNVNLSLTHLSFTSLGETLELSASVFDQHGNPMTGIDIEWSSSNSTVATVAAGSVTATGNGEARITATAESESASAEVDVAQVLASLSLDPPGGLWLTSGDSGRLQALATDALGSAIEGVSISWATADEAIATVDAAGWVTATSDGTTVITASTGIHEAEAEVAVSTPLPLEACRLTGTGDQATPSPFADWYVARTVGTLRAIMLFVDFSDTPTTETTQLIYDLNVPTAVAWFEEVSYGRMSLEVTAIHTWYRMPEPSSNYYPYSVWPHTKIFQHAVDAADADVDFSQFDLIYVMSSANSAILTNPAFNRPPGQGVFADGHELRNGTAVDGMRPWPADQPDRYAFSLIHETGHNLGMPDLRWKDGLEHPIPVGMWDLMSMHWMGTHLLSWHKFWLDWMPPGTIDCLGAGKFERVLNPFAQEGLDASIVKLSDAVAYVVESRGLFGFDRRRPPGPGVTTDYGICQPGILVYRVDANLAPPVPTIDVFPASRGHLPDCGPLALATYGLGAGRVSRFEDQDAGVVVEVIESVGDGYRVRITAGS